jgi:hypothetical protein
LSSFRALPRDGFRGAWFGAKDLLERIHIGPRGRRLSIGVGTDDKDAGW